MPIVNSVIERRAKAAAKTNLMDKVTDIVDWWFDPDEDNSPDFHDFYHFFEDEDIEQIHALFMHPDFRVRCVAVAATSALGYEAAIPDTLRLYRVAQGDCYGDDRDTLKAVCKWALDYFDPKILRVELFADFLIWAIAEVDRQFPLKQLRMF